MSERFIIDSAEMAVFTQLLGDLNEHKRYTNDMARLTARTMLRADRAPKLQECGTYVALQPRAESAGWEIVASNFCRLRLCPMCAWRRSLRLYANMLRVVEALPEYEWVLVTLTVPNVAGDELGATLSELFRTSRQLLKLPEFREFRGFLRCTEVTYNEDRNDFHPHLHFLVAVRPEYFKSRGYVSHARLLALWRQSWPKVDEVDIRKVKDPRRGCCEVCKYATKPLRVPDEVTPGKQLRRFGRLVEAVETLWRELHGRRLLQSGGVVRDVLKALQIDLEDDETQGTEDDGRALIRLTWDDVGTQYRPCRER